MKLWEDGGTSLSEKRCWDIYSFSVIGECLMQRLLCNFYAKIFISRWTEMCRSSFLKFVFFLIFFVSSFENLFTRI